MPDEKVSKMEAMRRALKKKGADAKAVDYQSYIKEEFGMEMTTGMVSNYKSTILKSEKASGSTQPKATAATALTETTPTPDYSDAFKYTEIMAVKDVVDRLGAEKVKKLIKAFEK